MAKRNDRRRGVRRIVALLVAVFCGFCVLCSVQEKYGYDFGLPDINVPSLTRYIGAFQKASGSGAPATSSPDTRDTLEVHQIDVGQSESILIVGPEKVVLIDAGENDQGDQVIRYLQKQGIDFIDILIGTHPHSDHIGGMDTVIRSMDVGEVILPLIPDDIIPTSLTYTDLLLAIEDKGLEITPAQPGDRYELGDGASLTILGPLRDYMDLNNESVVTRVVYGETSFLFTGDACKDVEKDLLASGVVLSSDVLGVGHHGSNTSSTKDFIQAVAPRIALISCGQDNSYGHPHREVIERLQEINARILRTDRNGSVKLISDGESIGIEAENEK